MEIREFEPEKSMGSNSPVKSEESGHDLVVNPFDTSLNTGISTGHSSQQKGLLWPHEVSYETVFDL